MPFDVELSIMSDSQASDTASAQGTLAGAGGSLIGAGIAELQANTTVALILVVIGAILIVIRAGLRYKKGIPPEIAPKAR